MKKTNVNSKDLTSYYQDEMDYLLSEGKEFARKYSKSAKNIDISEKGSTDPQIQRMIESFAFLTGSIQQQIDSTSSSLNFHILDNLCPLFTSPIPSSSIMKLIFNDKLNNKIIPSKSELEFITTEGQKIIYKTVYDVYVLPLEIAKIEFINLSNYAIESQCESESAIKITISLKENYKIKDINLDKIRFFISDEKSLSVDIYEMISTYDIKKDSVAFFEINNDTKLLSLGSIYFSGFNKNESLYSHDNVSNFGLKMLTEFLILPEKFLFFDVSISRILEIIKDTDNNTKNLDKFSIIIPINKNFNHTLKHINTSVLSLMCTPVVNIFNTVSEYISLDCINQNIQINPYKNQSNSIEVHSVEELIVQNLEKEEKYYPYFNHQIMNNEKLNFFLENKTLSSNGGVDTHINIIDNKSDLTDFSKKTGYAKILCNNRSTSQQISLNSIFSSTNIANANFSSITAFTPYINPPLLKNLEWAIISHISCNHLTFDNSLSPMQKIKNLLELYQLIEYSNNIYYAEILYNIKIQNDIEPFTNKYAHYFIPKVIVELTLEEDKFSILFGKILHTLFSYEIEMNTILETRLIKKNSNYLWKIYKSECNKPTL